MFVTTLVASLPFKRDLRNSVWFWQSKDFTEVFLPSVRCWLPQLVAVKLWKLRPLKDGHLTGCFLCFCTIFLFKASLVILRAWWLWNLIFGLQIQKTLRVSLRNKSGLENFSRFSSWSFNLYSNQLFFSSPGHRGFVPSIYRNSTKNRGVNTERRCCCTTRGSNRNG